MEKDIMWYDFLVTVILTLMALKTVKITLTITPAAPPTQQCRRVTCIALCLISGSSVGMARTYMFLF